MHHYGKLSEHLPVFKGTIQSFNQVNPFKAQFHSMDVWIPDRSPGRHTPYSQPETRHADGYAHLTDCEAYNPETDSFEIQMSPKTPP